MTSEMKSRLDETPGKETVNGLGRSYYCFCLEQAIINVMQAQALVRGDKIEFDHELPLILRKLAEALEAS